MNFKKFIRVEEGEEKKSVIYYDENENKLIPTGKDIHMSPMKKLSSFIQAFECDFQEVLVFLSEEQNNFVQMLLILYADLHFEL